MRGTTLGPTDAKVRPWLMLPSAKCFSHGGGLRGLTPTAVVVPIESMRIGGSTLKFIGPMSEQSRSGGGGGMQKSG